MVLDSSSDSDFDFTPMSKRQKTDSKPTLEERLQKLEGQVTGVSEKLKDIQSRLMEVRQCFECIVCKSPVSFPGIVSSCCKVMLGCEPCIAQWLASSSSCPQCRAVITMEGCSKVPFMRNLHSALKDAASGSSSPSSDEHMQT